MVSPWGNSSRPCIVYPSNAADGDGTTRRFGARGSFTRFLELPPNCLAPSGMPDGASSFCRSLSCLAVTRGGDSRVVRRFGVLRNPFGRHAVEVASARLGSVWLGSSGSMGASSTSPDARPGGRSRAGKEGDCDPWTARRGGRWAGSRYLRGPRRPSRGPSRVPCVPLPTMCSPISRACVAMRSFSWATPAMRTTLSRNACCG